MTSEKSMWFWLSRLSLRTVPGRMVDVTAPALLRLLGVPRPPCVACVRSGSPSVALVESLKGCVTLGR